MRLECIKYQWSESTEPEEINFFGATPTIIATIDLMNYLERHTLSDVEYTFENKTEKDNILYIEASSLRMNCRNLTRGQTIELKDFFEVYTSDNLIKWKLNYYDDNNILIYTGIIYKDGIKYPNPKATILNILTVGYEREFKEYYAQKPLVDMQGYGIPVTFDFDPVGLEVYNLFGSPGIFKQNFPNVNFALTMSIHYKYLEWGYTYAPSNSMIDINCFHAKCGYRNFADPGVNRFDFFNSLVLSMGWVWYFYLGKLYIKNRYDLTLGINTISANRFISHSVESSLLNRGDVIVIEDGQYYDTSSIGILAGRRAVFYSEKSPYYNIQRPMYSITYGSNGRYNNEYGGWTTAKIIDENEYGMNIQKMTFGAVAPNPYSYPLSLENFRYAKNTYLRIAPIINSYDFTNGLDYHNPREHGGGRFGNGNFIRIANASISSAHMLYNGSPANGIIKREGNKYRNYESYCNTSEFRNNFKTLLRSSASVNIKVAIKELITNPFQNFQITDYSYSNNVSGKTFFLNKLGFNAHDTGVTNLELYTI